VLRQAVTALLRVVEVVQSHAAPPLARAAEAVEMAQQADPEAPQLQVMLPE